MYGKVCKNLKEHATRIINYEKKGMILLTDEEIKLYEMQKVCYICKKEFRTNDNNNKYHKGLYIKYIGGGGGREFLWGS